MQRNHDLAALMHQVFNQGKFFKFGQVFALVEPQVLLNVLVIQDKGLLPRDKPPVVA